MSATGSILLAIDSQDQYVPQSEKEIASYSHPFIVMLKSGIGMQAYFCEIIIDESVLRQSLSIRYRSKYTWWLESIVISIACLRSSIRNHWVHTSLQYTITTCYIYTLRKVRITIISSTLTILYAASFHCAAYKMAS